MIVSWINQAAPIQKPDAHQPMKMNHSPRIGHKTCDRSRSDTIVRPSASWPSSHDRVRGRSVRTVGVAGLLRPGGPRKLGADVAQLFHEGQFEPATSGSKIWVHGFDHVRAPLVVPRRL